MLHFAWSQDIFIWLLDLLLRFLEIIHRPLVDFIGDGQRDESTATFSTLARRCDILCHLHRTLSYF
jgi:hypothetical protein